MAHRPLSFAWLSCVEGRHLPATVRHLPATVELAKSSEELDQELHHEAMMRWGWSGSGRGAGAVLRLVMAWHIREYVRTYNTSYGDVSAMYNIQYTIYVQYNAILYVQLV